MKTRFDENGDLLILVEQRDPSYGRLAAEVARYSIGRPLASPTAANVELREAGFTGVVTAKNGVKYHYVNGTRVPGPHAGAEAGVHVSHPEDLQGHQADAYASSLKTMGHKISAVLGGKALTFGEIIDKMEGGKKSSKYTGKYYNQLKKMLDDGSLVKEDGKYKLKYKTVANKTDSEEKAPEEKKEPAQSPGQNAAPAAPHEEKKPDDAKNPYKDGSIGHQLWAVMDDYGGKDSGKYSPMSLGQIVSATGTTAQHKGKYYNAIQAMVKKGHVEKTPDGKYLLKNGAASPSVTGGKPAPTPVADEGKKKLPTGMKKLGNLGGSAGVQKVEVDGKQYALKQSGAGQLAAEEGADNVYTAMGIAVPKAEYYKDGDKTSKLAPFIEGSLLKDYAHTYDFDKVSEELKKGFVLDALIANYDVVGTGFDNIKVIKQGDILFPVRIDNGSAFDYQAKGGKKLFTDDATTDLKSMMDPAVNPYAAKVFGSISEEQIHEQVQAIVAKTQEIVKATPQQYRLTVTKRIDSLAKAYPPTPKAPKVDPSKFPAVPVFTSSNAANVEANNKSTAEIKGLAEKGDLAGLKALYASHSPKVEQYKASIIEELENQLTPPTEKAKTAKTAKAAKAKKLPHSANGPTPDTPDEIRPELTKAEADAIKGYTDGQYGGLNQTLRKGNEPSGHQKVIHDSLQSAFAKVPVLDTPVEIKRGFSASGSELKEILDNCQQSIKGGKSLHLGGYLSCGKTGYSSPIRLHIKAVHALDLNPYSHYDMEGGGEILLSHDATFQVEKVEDESKNGYTKINIYMTQLVPAKKA